MIIILKFLVKSILLFHCFSILFIRYYNYLRWGEDYHIIKFKNNAKYLTIQSKIKIKIMIKQY